jgi:gluconolactonase
LNFMMDIAFATGLHEPETPVALQDGGWLVVEMGAEAGGVTRVGADGTTLERLVRTGRPNGVAIDGSGTLWVAESIGLGDGDGPGIKRVAPGGELEPVLDTFDGGPILWPNDLAFGPDGALYFTDTGLTPPELAGDAPLDSYDWDGRVFRYEPATGALSRLDSGLMAANGLVFGLDGALYVTESVTGHIYRYTLTADGAVATRTQLPSITDPDGPQPRVIGPDGLAAGDDGLLYVAVYGQGHIAVVDRDGAIQRRIQVSGAAPSNCAFGHGPEPRLHITIVEPGSLTVLDVGCGGAPVHHP